MVYFSIGASCSLSDSISAPIARKTDVTMFSNYLVIYRSQDDGDLSALARAKQRKREYSALLFRSEIIELLAIDIAISGQIWSL